MSSPEPSKVIHGSGGARIETWLDEQERPHRDDGPAIINRGTQDSPLLHEYFRHGEPHCERGPAFREFDEGKLVSFAFYLHGQQLTEDAYNAALAHRDADEQGLRSRVMVGEVHARCVCCLAYLIVPTAAGVGPWLEHESDCPRKEWLYREACRDEEGYMDWRYWIASAAKHSLTEEGAVLVSLTREDGPRAHGGLHRSREYGSVSEMMELVCREQRQLQENGVEVYAVRETRGIYTAYRKRDKALLIVKWAALETTRWR